MTVIERFLKYVSFDTQSDENIQMQVEGDMTVDAVGLVAVQAAHERRRIVNRHRRLGLAVQLHDGRIETLPRDVQDLQLVKLKTSTLK